MQKCFQISSSEGLRAENFAGTFFLYNLDDFKPG